MRLGSILFVGYIGLGFFFGTGGNQLRRPTNDGQPGLRRFWNRGLAFRLAGTLATIYAIAYVTMLFWWPAAQLEPIRQPLKGLWFATHYNSTWDIFFDGKLISNRYICPGITS